MADLELGNIAFNSNKNQVYNCPHYIIALLRELDQQLERVMWNLNQTGYESPFDNTGNKFENNTFKVEAYSWNDDYNQEYNFIYWVDKSKSNMDDLKISWYKYLGRDTTINQQIDENVMVSIFNDCLKSILDMDIKEDNL